MLLSLVYTLKLFTFASCSDYEVYENEQRNRNLVPVPIDTVYERVNNRFGMSEKEFNYTPIPFILCRELINYSLGTGGRYNSDELKGIVEGVIKSPREQKKIFQLLRLMIDEFEALQDQGILPRNFQPVNLNEMQVETPIKSKNEKGKRKEKSRGRRRRKSSGIITEESRKNNNSLSSRSHQDDSMFSSKVSSFLSNSDFSLKSNSYSKASNSSYNEPSLSSLVSDKVSISDYQSSKSNKFSESTSDYE